VAGMSRSRQLVVRTAVCAAVASAVLIASPVSPGAQGLFDIIWGSRGGDQFQERWNDRGRETWRERSGDANDPSGGQLNERRAVPASIERSKPSRAPASTRNEEDRDSVAVVSNGGSVAYCVRLCDGRFFPLSAQGDADPAELCNRFCPAAKTKIYSGRGIEHAVANNGKRYTSLDTAFAFRQKIVAGCTCNGTNSFGLARLDVSKDPTLRAGDIVARDGALMAFRGSRKTTYAAADFTPIATYAKGDSSLRKRLSGVKVAPPPAADPSASESRGAASGERAVAQQTDDRRR
jgi:hypothetical protein